MLTRKPRKGEYLLYKDSADTILYQMVSTFTTPCTTGNIINILNVSTGNMTVIIWRFSDRLNKNLEILDKSNPYNKHMIETIISDRKSSEVRNSELERNIL